MQKPTTKPRTALRTIVNPQGRRSGSAKPAMKKPRGKSIDCSNKENAAKESLVKPLKPKKNVVGLPPIPIAASKIEKVPNLDARKFIDLKRWYCIPRPQYPKACGITSLVGCWNYLFSNLGNGTLPFLTPESALQILGYTQDIGKIPFGQFTGNQMILKWFDSLCEYFGIQGKGQIYWKKDCINDTPENIHKDYISSIKDTKKAFIYHCHNHYFTPIGYDIVPNDPAKGYSDEIDLENSESWLIIGETSKKQPGMHVVKWKEVVNDIMCQDMYFYNIRERFKGMQIKREKTKNNHCFMLLQAL